MTVCPTFINRLNVALADDTALVFLGGPAGGIVNGQVQDVEVMRLVLTLKTLREASALLAAKVRELDAAQRKKAHQGTAEEVHSFSADGDLPLPRTPPSKH
jgi:hypothetical protein